MINKIITAYRTKLRSAFTKVRTELPDTDLEQSIRSLFFCFKDRPSKKSAEEIGRFLASNISGLVKKDADSNTFFILPYAEDLIDLLQKSRDRAIRDKAGSLKLRLYEYINFQHALFEESAKQVSFYFLKERV